MLTIALQSLGWLTFFTASLLLGAWLRAHPSKSHAEWTSRILHIVFWLWIAPAAVLGLITPGLTGYDEVLGLPPLPRDAWLLLIGSLALIIGAYFALVSNVVLWFLGKGANAIILTQNLVVSGIYQRTRNPMSLGLYLGCVGSGLLVGSTYMTLAALLVVIPIHIFYLKYFEELELELRLGPPYREYRQQVPFLLPRLSPPAK